VRWFSPPPCRSNKRRKIQRFLVPAPAPAWPQQRAARPKRPPKRVTDAWFDPCLLPVIPSIIDARQSVWIPRRGRRRISNHNNRIFARPQPKPRVRVSEWLKILTTVPCAPHRRRIVPLMRQPKPALGRDCRALTGPKSFPDISIAQVGFIRLAWSRPGVTNRADRAEACGR